MVLHVCIPLLFIITRQAPHSSQFLIALTKNSNIQRVPKKQTIIFLFVGYEILNYQKLNINCIFIIVQRDIKDSKNASFFLHKFVIIKLFFDHTVYIIYVYYIYNYTSLPIDTSSKQILIQYLCSIFIIAKQFFISFLLKRLQARVYYTLYIGQCFFIKLSFNP